MKNNNLEKVLIISYFYPPCNFTAARRTHSWVSQFHKYGLYPILITRNWDINPREFKDISLPSGKEIIEQTTVESSVFYLPFLQTNKDKFITRYGLNRFVFLRKVWSFVEQLLNIYRLSLNYKPLYQKAKTLLNNDNTINKLIISGGPFETFLIGFKLKKEFKKIKLIYDYRDLWTLHPFKTRSLLKFLEHRLEKKILTSASLVTYVEETGSRIIQKKFNVITKTIANGYEKINIKKKQQNSKSNTLTILFSGTFYQNYDLELLKASILSCLNTYNFNLELMFLGADVQEGINQYLSQQFGNINSDRFNLMVTKRIRHEDAIEIMQNADILLMFPIKHAQIPIPSSKLYQYLPLTPPILLLPSDQSIMSSIIRQTQSGKVCNSVKEVVSFFNEVFQSKQKDITLEYKENKSLIEKYSRSFQTQKLAEILKLL